MPRSILVRRTANGGYCGAITPMPKMPAKDSLFVWKDAGEMAKALKSMHITIVAGSEEVSRQLEKHGIASSRRGTTRRA